MATKTFETAFNIGAKFTGGPAFAQAQRAVASVSKSVRTMGANLAKGAVGFGKHVGAITTGILSSAVVLRGLQEGHEFLIEGIQLARESNTAYEDLLVTLGRIPFFQKMGAAGTEKQAKAFQELAEQMEETGLDAEVLMSMFKTGAASMVFNTRQLHDNRNALQDLGVMLFKTNATEEEMAGMMNMFTKAVRSNVSGPLVKLGILTKDQSKHFNKLKDDTKQAAYLLDIIGKGRWVGEMARQSGTLEGVLDRQKIIWDNIKKAIGQPFIDKQQKVVQAFNKIGKAMEPIAGKIGERLTDALDKFANMLDKDGETISKAIDLISKSFGWILDHWQEVVTGLVAITAALVALKVASVAATAIGLLSNPIGWVVLALGGLGVAIWAAVANWDSLKAKALEVWDAIKSKWGEFATFFGDQWTETIKALETGLFGPMGGVFDTLSQQWETSIKDTTKQFEDLWALIPQGFKDSLVGVYQTFHDAFVPIFSWLSEQFKSLNDKIWNAFNNIPSKDAIPRTTAGGPGTSEEDLIGPMPEGDADQNALIPDVPGHQLGGLIAHPMISKLAERGVPEMVIPMQATDRSRGLLGEASAAIGGIRGMTMRQRMEGANPIKLTMNAPITINGAPVGQEGAIGREVQRALQDPIKNLLTQIKAARAYESRLGYV